MRQILYYSSIILNVLFIIAFIYMIQALGGITFLKYKINNRGLGSEYEHRKTLYEKMPLDTTDIVFLGNSLTAQCDWSELLQQPNIKNRGIPGETTDGILRRLPSITDANPSKLFLMIGVNDLLFVTPELVIENYKKIVSNILNNSPSTELYLYSILPVNPEVRTIAIKNEDILKVNESIQQIAIDYQLTYIDLHSSLSTVGGWLAQEYTSDGIHLNGEGYLIWKDELEQYLRY